MNLWMMKLLFFGVKIIDLTCSPNLSQLYEKEKFCESEDTPTSQPTSQGLDSDFPKLPGNWSHSDFCFQ